MASRKKTMWQKLEELSDPDSKAYTASTIAVASFAAGMWLCFYFMWLIGLVQL